MDCELVARPTVIRLYLNGRGKAADLSKTSAKITLLTGTEKQEIELKPVGDKLGTRQFQGGPGHQSRGCCHCRRQAGNGTLHTEVRLRTPARVVGGIGGKKVYREL